MKQTDRVTDGAYAATLARKKQFKRAFLPLRAAALFCLCVAVGLAGGTVRAVDGLSAPPADAEPDEIPGGSPAETPAETPAEMPAEAAQKLLSDGLLAGSTAIDLSAVCLPRTELGEVFSAVMNDAPELFYVESRLSYTYDVTGIVLTVTPSYRLAGDELAEAQALWQTTLAEVSAALATAQETARRVADALPVGQVRPWSEADTVLFLHDYIASAYDYDTTASHYDALGLFRDGVGVCQAYALAFMAFGRAAGLEVDMVVSREMDHAWNHVLVEGEWYHVDVTRDDPIRDPGSPSVVRHERLLRSDAGMETLGYSGFSCACGHSCSSTRYETASGEAVLAGIREPLVHLGTGWFRSVDRSVDRSTDTLLWEPVPFPASCAAVTGDMDSDGILSLRDLLLLDICMPPADLSSSQAAWRQYYWEKRPGE